MASLRAHGACCLSQGWVACPRSTMLYPGRAACSGLSGRLCMFRCMLAAPWGLLSGLSPPLAGAVPHLPHEKSLDVPECASECAGIRCETLRPACWLHRYQMRDIEACMLAAQMRDIEACMLAAQVLPNLRKLDGTSVVEWQQMLNGTGNENKLKEVKRPP